MSNNLHNLIQGEETEEIKILLESDGSFINQVRIRGFPPLIIAIYDDSVEGIADLR